MTNRYDTDFYGWTKDQADLLRYGLLDQLDTPNLLKEIESIGHSQQSELESQTCFPLIDSSIAAHTWLYGSRNQVYLYEES
ncbi:DUF29 family protein [Yersinia enterocolitica]